MLKPMGAALGVTLLALLMERALRLFDLISSSNATLAPVLTMLLGLTPHYLGLALPAAFCIGLLLTLDGLCRRNELDALESAGWSLRRIGFAFVVSGVILSLFGVALYGYLQPYSRYAYRAAKHAVAEAGWSGRVTGGVFLDAGDGMVISAEEVDPAGRVLSNVFILNRTGEGETATTARRGVVVADPATRSVRLRLDDGVSLGPSGALRFERLFLERRFDLDANPFRARGETREMTLGELAEASRPVDGAPADPVYAAELHARLVRALTPVSIAFACIPLAVSAKRGRSWPRVVAALAGLMAYHHLLLFLEGLAAQGRVSAPAALWSAWAAFLAAAVLLYLMTPSQGGGFGLGRLLRRARPAGGAAAG